MRAGIDRREQKKAGAELERATVAKIRKTQARGSTRMDNAESAVARTLTCMSEQKQSHVCICRVCTPMDVVCDCLFHKAPLGRMTQRRWCPGQ